MFKGLSALALLCLMAAPAVGMECTFGKDSFGYDSIFRSLSVTGAEGTIATRRGEERELQCIGANEPKGMLSCVFHFPDGEGAYIYTLSPDRTFLVFTAYASNATAPATMHETSCTD